MAMSPRKRARMWRGVQYALLVVLLVVALVVADLGTLRSVFFDVDILRSMWPDVITTALKNTVLYTASGFTFGLGLGLVLALMRLSPVGPYRWMATGFIEFFRGVPALVVFIALGPGVSLAFPGREIPGGNLGVATVALGIVGGAYMAETIRAGIQAVPKGQMEAARSLYTTLGFGALTMNGGTLQVDFDQDVHAKAVCGVFKLGGLCVFKGGHDQKDVIGT